MTIKFSICRRYSICLNIRYYSSRAISLCWSDIILTNMIPTKTKDLRSPSSLLVLTGTCARSFTACVFGDTFNKTYNIIRSVSIATALFQSFPISTTNFSTTCLIFVIVKKSEKFVESMLKFAYWLSLVWTLVFVQTRDCVCFLRTEEKDLLGYACFLWWTFCVCTKLYEIYSK